MKEQTVERFHKDGLMVSINSPEAFDEYFWKLKLRDNYIKDFYLELNQIDESLLSEFDAYLKLVCLSYKKQKYLSKKDSCVTHFFQVHSIYWHTGAASRPSLNNKDSICRPRS